MEYQDQKTSCVTCGLGEEAFNARTRIELPFVVQLLNKHLEHCPIRAYAGRIRVCTKDRCLPCEIPAGKQQIGFGSLQCRLIGLLLGLLKHIVERSRSWGCRASKRRCTITV